MRRGHVIKLTAKQRQSLEKIVARASNPAGLVRRARVVLAERCRGAGVRDRRAAGPLGRGGVAYPAPVSGRRARGAGDAAEGAAERTMRCRRRRSSGSCELAMSPPPAGRSRWTTRLLAKEVGADQRLRLGSAAPPRPEAASGAHLQGESGPQLRREGQGRGRPVPEPARARRGAQRRREDVDSSAGAHPAAAPAAHGARGAPYPRLQAPRRRRSLRGAWSRHREGDSSRERHAHRERLPRLHDEGRARVSATASCT